MNKGEHLSKTQHCPDSPHHPQFPTILLCHGETYESETVWFFGVEG